MSLLTENIRWVQSITLEGERLTADDVVVRRDMLAGARIDTLGVRVSFIFVLVLFVINIVASIAAFLETLQFFQPDYTVFALSLLPLLVLGFASYRLRPRQHFTVLLRDGSALGVLSRDGNFLTRCLEAFERLWADPMRAQSSLYLHAAHRSVDFGPPAGGIDVLANAPDEGPMALELPVFGDDEEGEAPSVSSDTPPDLPDMPVEDEPSDPPSSEEIVAPLPPLPMNEDDEEKSEEREQPEQPLTQVSPALEADEPYDDAADQDEPELPPLPSFADEDEDESSASNNEQPDDETEDDPADHAKAELPDGDEDEPDPKPFGDHVGVPAAAFVDVRPKVEALVRLLRERAPAQGISDAVDVLELMTRRGCDTPVEVRALARSVELLRERMTAYPTAVDLLNAVENAGHLKTHPALQG